MKSITTSLLLIVWLTTVSCSKEEKNHFDFPLFLNKTYKLVERLSTEGAEHTSQFWNKLLSDGNRACARDIFYIFWGFYKQEEWSFQMLDAWAKIANGRSFADGFSLQHGSPAICKKAKPPNYSTNYCAIKTYLPLDEISFMTLELCLPDSCNDIYLNDMMSSVEAFWDILSLPIRINFICEQSKSRASWDFFFIFVLIICIIFFSLTIYGTIYHLYLWRIKNISIYRVNEYPLTTPENKPTIVLKKKVEGYSKMKIIRKFEEKDGKMNETLQFTHQISAVKCNEWLLCFSAIRNGSKIFNLNVNGGQLKCIHGIRALSVKVVVFGHIFLIFPINSDNIAQFLNYSESQPFLYPLFFNLTYAVDSFFVLSGLLVCYLYLKMAKERQPTWTQFYLERIVRLAPAFYVCIFVFDGIFMKLRRDEYHILFDGLLENCVGSMWTNFFFVSNIFKESCMTYSWYLSCDMQFFLISPIILTALMKSKTRGVVTLMAIFAVSSFTTFQIAYSREFDLTLYRDLFVFLKQWTSQMFDLYTQPYCRIGPYLIGMMCGWILFERKCTFQLTKFSKYLAWMVSLLLMYMSVWYTYYFKTYHFSSAVCLFLLRDIWAAGLAILIFLCCTGNGGIINSFLAWPPWMVLSRLSYSTYLAHFMIIHYIAAVVVKNLHFTILSGILFFMVGVPIIFFGGLLLYLTVEAPAYNIKEIIFQKKKNVQNKRIKKMINGPSEKNH